MDKCGGLLFPKKPTYLGGRSEGGDSIVSESHTKSPDYETMKEIIDMLKSHIRPQKPSEDTGRNLNMNS